MWDVIAFERKPLASRHLAHLNMLVAILAATIVEVIGPPALNDTSIMRVGRYYDRRIVGRYSRFTGLSRQHFGGNYLFGDARILNPLNAALSRCQVSP